MPGTSPSSISSRRARCSRSRYVGNKGYHVTPGGTNYNINQPTIVGFGTLSTNQRRLFYQKFGWTQTIKYFSDDASVKFNSLQVRGEKRFASGLQFQGNFTWASAFDFANDYFFWNHNIDYGRENGVRRFVFNFNDVYELPFGKSTALPEERVARVGSAWWAAGSSRASAPGNRVFRSRRLRQLRQRRRHRALPRQPGG